MLKIRTAIRIQRRRKSAGKTITKTNVSLCKNTHALLKFRYMHLRILCNHKVLTVYLLLSYNNNDNKNKLFTYWQLTKNAHTFCLYCRRAPTQRRILQIYLRRS